ncbi:MAG: nitroreductase family protein [Dysgonamonadaceae bacterium]
MESKSNEQNAIKLYPPDMERGTSLMCALANRKSTRDFNNKPLELQDLSDLLWAAKGINRPESEGMTSSNSLAKKEVDVYACTPEGACLHCAEEHTLIPVTETNLIPALAGGQEYVMNTPLVLLLVADNSVLEGIPEPMKNTLAPLDTGIVSQNIALFCAANYLDTVARGTMDIDTLKRELNLKDSQCLFLNHPISYQN